MDPAQKPDSRRLLTLGTLCVALIVAANLLIVPWLHEPAGEDRADSGAEEFPLEIRLLQELGPEAIEQLDDQTADADVPAQGAASAEMLDDGVPNSGSGQLGSGDDVVQSALACRVWGPIGVEGVVEALRQQIESAGDVIDIQASELSSDPDYLVYIDTDQNIDNARRLLQELESQSIDAYVISGGSLVNSVSAGVFSRRSRAEAHQQRLTGLGYESIVEPLERAHTVYHLYARVPQGFETEGHPSKDCAAIASLR